jgi:hypothetical protein
MSNPLFDILHNKKIKTDGKYISQEFQDFAYRMAMAITGPSDRKTISMCMRLAKKHPRSRLERALQFVKDANARNKVALFLWKIKEFEKQETNKK